MKKLITLLSCALLLISCNPKTNNISEDVTYNTKILSQGNNIKINDIKLSDRSNNQIYMSIPVPKNPNNPYDTENYVYSADFDGYSIKNIKPLIKGSNPILIENTKKVIFRTFMSINIMNTDTSNLETLATITPNFIPDKNSYFRDFLISKNKDFVIFSIVDGSTSKIYIYSLEIKNKKMIKLYECETINESDLIALSPDNNKIVVSVPNNDKAKNGSALLLLNIDGSGKKFIAQNENYHNTFASFSPDGSKIAYTQHVICPSGTTELPFKKSLSKITIESYLNKKQVKNLFNDRDLDPITECETNDPSINSDSSPMFLSNDKILFTSSVSPANDNSAGWLKQLFVLDLKSSERKQITNSTDSGSKFYLLDSERNRIIYENINGLYTINIDGTDKRKIEIETPQLPKK